jgi:hypothetical protein
MKREVLEVRETWTHAFIVTENQTFSIPFYNKDLLESVSFPQCSELINVVRPVSRTLCAGQLKNTNKLNSLGRTSQSSTKNTQIPNIVSLRINHLLPNTKFVGSLQEEDLRLGISND